MPGRRCTGMRRCPPAGRRGRSTLAAALPQGLLALEVALDAFVEPLAQVDHRVEMAVDARKAQVQPQPQRARAQRLLHVVEAAVLVDLVEEPRRAGLARDGVPVGPVEE